MLLTRFTKLEEHWKDWVFSVDDSFELLSRLTNALILQDVVRWENTLKEYRETKFGFQFYDDVVETLWEEGIRIILSELNIYPRICVVEMMLEKLCVVECEDEIRLSILKVFIDSMDMNAVRELQPLNHVVRNGSLFKCLYAVYVKNKYPWPPELMLTILIDGAMDVLEFCFRQQFQFLTILGFKECVKYANLDNNLSRSKLKIDFLICCLEWPRCK